MNVYKLTLVVSEDKSGNPLHTVAKNNVTENELRLLRGIHGYERARNVEKIGEIDREERLDLLRLARQYGDTSGIYANTGVRLIQKHFGVELHEFDNWLAEQVEAEQENMAREFDERQRKFNMDTARQATLAAQGAIVNLEAAAPAPARPKSSAEAVMGKKAVKAAEATPAELD